MNLKKLFLVLTFVALILITVFVNLISTPATAQESAETTHPLYTVPVQVDPALSAQGIVQTEAGLWVQTEQSAAAASVPLASGGPDEFGYTWSDAQPYNWISASSGTNTGINDQYVASGALPIGFTFRFYENTYTQIYASRNGYLSFNNAGLYNGQSRIPTPGAPDDVIAPYWTPIDNVAGYVRYLQGGSAPNRWFIVEWNRVQQHYDNATNEYTFQTILFENGNIDFQYQTMNYGMASRWCEDSGIEDSQGLDGFSISEFCRTVPSNHSVRIYRPAPQARVKVYPLHQGSFSHASATETFELPIRNTGELGSDVYDITVSSSWTIRLLAADGVTPLIDTNSNGMVDTGSITEGATTIVIVEIDTPGSAIVGDYGSALINVRSALDSSEYQTATLRTTVPSSFAQIYQDNADYAVTLGLNLPQAQVEKQITPDYRPGNDIAVVETTDGHFLSAWWIGQSRGNIYTYEIEYTLIDKTGTTIRPTAKLTDNRNATYNTYEQDIALAATPDGRIGVLWSRELYNSANSTFNYNIYFAIIGQNGNIEFGPTNITNNQVWGTYSDLNVPRMYNSRVSATEDNRFVLAWRQFHYGQPSGDCSSYCSVDDIYVAVRSSTGAVVKNPTRYTQDTVGYHNAYYYPALTQLAGNKTLLVIAQSGDTPGLLFAVLDSNGSTTRPLSMIPNANSYSIAPTATQLTNNNIVVAWSEWSSASDRYRVHYAVLTPTYSLVAGPVTLGNEAAITGDQYVSIAADADNRAILTWMDGSLRRNLYYALVSGNGNQLTAPMIFKASSGQPPNINTSYETYGNTTYSWSPHETDGVIMAGSTRAFGPPDGVAGIPIAYSSYGTSVAEGVTISMTLSSDLTYVSDTSGVLPVINGNVITWELPDVAFLDVQRFMVSAMIPADADLGTLYPVALEIDVDGGDADPSNNTDNLEVMAAAQVVLPIVTMAD